MWNCIITINTKERRLRIVYVSAPKMGGHGWWFKDERLEGWTLTRDGKSIWTDLGPRDSLATSGLVGIVINYKTNTE